MERNKKEQRERIADLWADKSGALRHLGRLGAFYAEPCDHYDSSDQMLRRMKAKVVAEIRQIEEELNSLQSL